MHEAPAARPAAPKAARDSNGCRCLWRSSVWTRGLSALLNTNKPLRQHRAPVSARRAHRAARPRRLSVHVRLSRRGPVRSGPCSGAAPRYITEQPPVGGVNRSRYSTATVPPLALRGDRGQAGSVELRRPDKQDSTEQTRRNTGNFTPEQPRIYLS
ncbi:hypothetical protein MHYP_G00159100 [Metynnis hypsauchen]